MNLAPEQRRMQGPIRSILRIPCHVLPAPQLTVRNLPPYRRRCLAKQVWQ